MTVLLKTCAAVVAVVAMLTTTNAADDLSGSFWHEFSEMIHAWPFGECRDEIFRYFSIRGIRRKTITLLLHCPLFCANQGNNGGVIG